MVDLLGNCLGSAVKVCYIRFAWFVVVTHDRVDMEPSIDIDLVKESALIFFL